MVHSYRHVSGILLSRFLFAFRFLDKTLTWCRVPQGYTESPSIFNQILKKNLESLVLSEASVRVQYIDDLLIASKTKDACRDDTIKLLNHLVENGHKVSPNKLQYCLQQVLYLGHYIEKEARKVSTDRINTILQMSPPKTQKEVRKFLGMVGYFHQWIHIFSLVTKPLQRLIWISMYEPLPWDDTCLSAFLELREPLCHAPAL